jgi:hypothetical protein
LTEFTFQVAIRTPGSLVFFDVHWRLYSTVLGLALALAGVAPASAQQAASPPPGAGAWAPGPAAAGDKNQLAGVIDAPASGATLAPGPLSLSGWFVDTTAQGWTGVDDVEIFDGTMESGRPLGHAQFQQNRPDVAAALKNQFWAASGWSASVSTLGLPAGATTLSVYVHTPGRGWWLRQVPITLRPTQPVPAPPAPSPFGNDLSYPQCPTGAEPSLPAFGIVGVNGGRPFTANPCLARQFTWTLTSRSASQPRLSLYMNTANPGPGVSPNWPPTGTTSPRACDGSASADCAYDYGWLSAQDAFGRAVAVTGASGANQAPWWLDVEQANSWSDALDTNAAVLEGAIGFLQAQKIASIGIYSTLTDWEIIIGTPSANNPFAALPNWRPGAADAQDAPGWCARSVTGGRVRFVQFSQAGFDTDFSCP